jgi:homoserine O-acetyltransferase
MPKEIPLDSVGIVHSCSLHFDESLTLRSGKKLPQYDIAYETYGELNSQASNAILICHALSGDQHAAGYHSMEDKNPGWWDTAIGPGKVIDTNFFFVVCINNLGGCSGSTGPASINPLSGELYGPDFPILAVRDWVKSQCRLADKLNILKWAAVVGGSLGGMQVLRWAIQYPERLQYAVVIASAPKLSAQNIAFNEVARQMIMNDPNFHDGYYHKYNTIPKTGLMQARMLGHLTYLSDDAMKNKFDRELKSTELSYSYGPEFQVESYLHYQGNKFANKFDANTYMLMTKALDYFDPTVDYNHDLTECLSHAQCQFLVVSFTTDWRFSPARSEEIVNSLIEANKSVTYACIDSNSGHDAFLLPIPRYLDVFGAYMDQIKMTIKEGGV